MSLFSFIGNGIESLLGGIGKTLGGIGSSIFGNGLSSVPSPGFVDFVNTPATLSNAITGAMSSGSWIPGGVSDFLSGATGTLLRPVTVNPPGGPLSPYTPLPDPQTIQPVTGVAPFNPGSSLIPTSTGTNFNLSGLLDALGPITSGGAPQTVQQVTGVPPPGNVDLINTPGSIAPGGITPPGQTPPPQQPQSKPFDWENFLKTATSLGILGSGVLGNNNGLGPAADKLNALAEDLSGRSRNILDTALANQQGFLNAPALNGIERRLRQSEAAMRKSYNEMGMSGSTMEQQDLAALRERANEQTFTIGQQMATTGLQTAAQMIGDQSTIYTELMNAQIQKDEELAKALAEFAAASAR